MYQQGYVANWNLVEFSNFKHRHFLLVIEVPAFLVITYSYITIITTIMGLLSLPATAIDAIVGCLTQCGPFF